MDSSPWPSAADVKKLGQYYDDLIREDTWIRRRVDTIRLLDRDRVEHKVTLDIDNEKLGVIAKRWSLVGAEIPIPLEHIKKELQLDLDVKDQSGVPLAVTPSDDDSKIAYGLVLAAIERHKIDPDTLTPRIHQQLYRMAQRPSLDVLKDITERAKAPGYKSKKGVERVQLDGPDVEQWRTLLSVDEIFGRLLQLTQSYFLSTTIAAKPDGVTMVKFRYVEVPETVGSAPFFLRNLGFTSPKIYVPAPGVGTAQREHTRVQAPEGSLISTAKLVSNDGYIGSTDTDVPEGKYGKRESHERAVVYTSHLPATSTYGVVLRVVPTLNYFFVPAWVSTLVLTIFLVVAQYVQWCGHYLTRDTTNADAVFAMLGLVPSLVSAYLIRAGEHQIVARLQFVPRVLLFLAALSAVFVGGTIAINHPALSTVLTVAIVANAFVLLYLSVAIVSIWALSRRRRASTFPDLPPAPELPVETPSTGPAD